MRILLGYQAALPEGIDRARYDVRCVRFVANGSGGPPATLAEMQAQCPPDWVPDVYYHSGLAHHPIPTDIEDFDSLTVTDVQDWHRGGRAMWAGVGFFDCVLTERNAGALLNASGYANTRFARFWGVDPDLHRVLPDIARDIDVLFIGSLNGEIWEERNRWVARLARLSARYKVVIAMGHYGEHYVRLTNRAKIVFNRSVNGCTNQRAYDGPACGALVFNEAENDECRDIFTDGEHCVYYDRENLEERLDYYLAREDARRQIVENGRRLVLVEHTEAAHWNAQFALIEADWRTGTRYRPGANLSLRERSTRKAWQIYVSSQPLATETARALIEQAEAEGLEPRLAQTAQAALQGWRAHYAEGADKIQRLTQALIPARQAAKARNATPLALMTWAFLLLERAEATGGAHPTGRNDIVEAAVALAMAAEACETAFAAEDVPASEPASETAPALGTGPAAVLKDAGPFNSEWNALEGLVYPRWSDLFDARLERAFLARNIDPALWARTLRATLAWRCRTMLSDLAFANDQLEEARRQAAQAANDLPDEAEAVLRLARCEAVTGRWPEALAHYAEGLARAPLTYAVWPDQTALLTATGQSEAAQKFVNDCLTIIQAIPSFAAIRPALLAALQTGTTEPTETNRGGKDEQRMTSANDE